MPPSLEQQLSVYLTDAHAIELQALAQVKRARKVAGDPEIAAAFEKHTRETERHRLYVENRLNAREWATVPQKDLTAKATGVGMAWFSRLQPDTPGKLVVHAYSYEHMEIAAYDLLGRLAHRAGDRDTALTARVIGDEEHAMAERLGGLFERAVDASLGEREPDDMGGLLNKYLADVHAIEAQAIQLLKKASKLAGPGEPAGAGELASAFEQHLDQTRRHSELLEQRLQARGTSPSAIKDTALRFGALNVGMLLGAQVDTTAKLAAFAYAFEHLEVAAYELVKVVARRAHDDETIALADAILYDEWGAAARVHGLFDEALNASLEAAGVTVS